MEIIISFINLCIILVLLGYLYCAGKVFLFNRKHSQPRIHTIKYDYNEDMVQSLQDFFDTFAEPSDIALLRDIRMYNYNHDLISRLTGTTKLSRILRSVVMVEVALAFIVITILCSGSFAYVFLGGAVALCAMAYSLQDIGSYLSIMDDYYAPINAYRKIEGYSSDTLTHNSLFSKMIISDDVSIDKEVREIQEDYQFIYRNMDDLGTPLMISLSPFKLGKTNTELRFYRISALFGDYFITIYTNPTTTFYNAQNERNSDEIPIDFKRLHFVTEPIRNEIKDGKTSAASIKLSNEDHAKLEDYIAHLIDTGYARFVLVDCFKHTEHLEIIN